MRCRSGRRVHSILLKSCLYGYLAEKGGISATGPVTPTILGGVDAGVVVVIVALPVVPEGVPVVPALVLFVLVVPLLPEVVPVVPALVLFVLVVPEPLIFVLVVPEPLIFELIFYECLRKKQRS